MLKKTFLLLLISIITFQLSENQIIASDLIYNLNLKNSSIQHFDEHHFSHVYLKSELQIFPYLQNNLINSILPCKQIPLKKYFEIKWKPPKEIV